MKQSGFSTPSNTAVVGVNNDLVSPVIDPRLTTIHYLGQEMGEIAAQTLINHPNGLSRLSVTNAMIRYAAFPSRILYVWLILACQTVFCQVNSPRLVSDGMVLQQEPPVTIWGWASVGKSVSVTLDGQTTTTSTGQDGKWNIQLPPMKVGGPYQMHIKDSNQVTLNDVAVGDVWLCSGQSNMALPMERVKERYGEMIAQATNPAIRHFFLSTRYNFQGPMEDQRERQFYFR